LLVREGGALTDTDGQVRIRYAFYDGRPLDWVPSYLYSETYHFDEAEEAAAASRSVSGGLFGGPILRTGDRDPAPDTAARDRHLNMFFSAGLSGGHDHVEATDSKRLRGTFRNRETEFLRVRAGILIELEIEAVDRRGVLEMPQWARDLPVLGAVARFLDGGRTRLMFRIDDAAELLFDPERAHEFDLRPARGVPIPAGRYIPSGTEGNAQARRQRVVDASALPSFAAPTTYPGGQPVPVGGNTGWYTLAVDGLDPLTRTVLHEGHEVTVDVFANLVRDLPDYHNRPVVLVAGGAGQLGAARNGEFASFAQQLSILLRQDVLATPDDVWQDTHGRVRAARFAVDRNGRPAPGGFRPGNWIRYHADGTHPQVHGEDLQTVIHDEVPGTQRISPRHAMPAVFPPAVDTGWTGATGPLDHPGGQLAGRIDLGAVVIQPATVAEPMLGPAIDALPGYTVVHVPVEVRPDALLAALQRLLPLLPADQTNLQFTREDAANGGRHSLAQHIADRLLVEVIAYGKGSPDGSAPRWSRFSRYREPLHVRDALPALSRSRQPSAVTTRSARRRRSSAAQRPRPSPSLLIPVDVPPGGPSPTGSYLQVPSGPSHLRRLSTTSRLELPSPLLPPSQARTHRTSISRTSISRTSISTHGEPSPGLGVGMELLPPSFSRTPSPVQPGTPSVVVVPRSRLLAPPGTATPVEPEPVGAADELVPSRALGIADRVIGDLRLQPHPHAGESEQDVRDQVGTVAAALNQTGIAWRVLAGEADSQTIRERFRAGFRRLLPFNGRAVLTAAVEHDYVAWHTDRPGTQITLPELTRAEPFDPAEPLLPEVDENVRLVLRSTGTARQVGNLIDRTPESTVADSVTAGGEVAFAPDTPLFVTRVDPADNDHPTTVHLSDTQPMQELTGGQGVYLAGPNEAAAVGAIAAALPRFDRTYVVAAHLSPDRQHVILADGTELRPADLAALVRNAPGYIEGMPVVLVICAAATPPAAGGRSRPSSPPRSVRTRGRPRRTPGRPPTAG